MPESTNKRNEQAAEPLPEFIAHYRILKRLGKGGMGEVFLAEDVKQHGRKVALKVLLRSLSNEPNRIRRFKQEARAVLALNHPNILTIYEIGEWDDSQYIATEYIEGETLRAYLWNSRLQIDEVLGIAIQIAMALEAAHSAGIVHRDIKPENVMMISSGQQQSSRAIIHPHISFWLALLHRLTELNASLLSNSYINSV